MRYPNCTLFRGLGLSPVCNPRFKTFINVWGSRDWVGYVSPTMCGFIGRQDFSDSGVSTFNIEVVNAGHNDFWYSEAKWQGKNDPQAAEVNRKTAIILAQLAQASQDDDDLQDFLRKLKIENGVYKIYVDPTI